MKELVTLSTKTITLNRNDFLTVKGSIDANVYFIQSGSVRVYVVNDDEEQIIRFGYSGNIIAALDSFFTAQPTDFFIQAIKQTVVHVIPREKVEIFRTSTENQQRWTAMLESFIIQQLEREIDLLTQSPKERYERVLKRSPQLFQEIPHRYIANYLRMSAETLSRLKKS